MNTTPPHNFRSSDRRWAYSGRRSKGANDYIFEQVLADWLGPEHAHLEAETKQPPPQAISALLSPLLNSLDHDDNYLLRQINDHWQELVMDEIFRHATPRKIIGNTLYLETTNASWRFHIERLYKSEITALIHRFSDRRITEVRFVAGGKTHR